MTEKKHKHIGARVNIEVSEKFRERIKEKEKLGIYPPNTSFSAALEDLMIKDNAKTLTSPTHSSASE